VELRAEGHDGSFGNNGLVEIEEGRAHTRMVGE
jgi:hypothetical protein